MSKQMTREELNAHRQTHTKQNSHWMNDAKGIPLCRVCEDCQDAAEKTYRPEVLGKKGRYEDVVEEQIEPDGDY
jgi:hypothetical protein